MLSRKGSCATITHFALLQLPRRPEATSATKLGAIPQPDIIVVKLLVRVSVSVPRVPLS